MRRLDFLHTRRIAAPVNRVEGMVSVHQAYVPHIHSLTELVQVVEVFVLRHEYGGEWALGEFIARSDLAVGV